MASCKGDPCLLSSAKQLGILPNDKWHGPGEAPGSLISQASKSVNVEMHTIKYIETINEETRLGYPKFRH